MKFKIKEATIVEAITCKSAMKGFSSCWGSLPKWLVDAYEEGDIIPAPEGIYLLDSNYSVLSNPNDWLICGANGEIYLCGPDTFEKMFEPINE